MVPGGGELGGSRLGEAPNAFLSTAGLISEEQIPSRDVGNPVRLKGQKSKRRELELKTAFGINVLSSIKST